jgi:hypothetical protein
MKFQPIILSVLVAFCVGGCASSVSQLKQGMTKEEVVKLMGPPKTTQAEGDREYLSYILEEEAGSTSQGGTRAPASAFGSEMRTGTAASIGGPSEFRGGGDTAKLPSGNSNRIHIRYKKRPFCVRLSKGYVEAFGYGRPRDLGAKGSTDAANVPTYTVTTPVVSLQLIKDSAGSSSEIREVKAGEYLPFKNLHRDDVAKENQIELISVEATLLPTGAKRSELIRVRYSLSTLDEANVDLVINLQDTGNYTLIGRVPISRGSGELEFSSESFASSWYASRKLRYGVLLRGGTNSKAIAENYKSGVVPP